MARPSKGYYAADGKRVPGVTTITGRWKESGGLIHWAWELGREGRDYRQERDAAANAGSIAHDMIEAYLLGEDYALPAGTEPALIERAEKGYAQFRAWWGQTVQEVVATETPLVSERHRFGGTPDAIFRAADGRLAIGDWKTSNAIYHDMLVQVAAYAVLWDEHYPHEPITGGAHICRFSKEHADFEHRYFGDIAEAREQFLRLRAAYEADKRLKKRVR